MPSSLQEWLANPITSRLAATFLGLLLVVLLVKFLRRSLSQRIQDNDARYRTRKFVTFLGYLLAILLVAIIFSDKLGGLSFAFGVAGAGIAFALQEVIASFAGWFAIVFAQFYKTGDRVQLGGIKGDVIDVGILRTTMMEIGEWVKGDLYSGRVVRIANSFVFKEPVFNYSAEFPFLWDEILVPVQHGSDLPFAKETFQKIANEVLGDYPAQAFKAWEKMVEKFLIENANVKPIVTLTADQNCVSFTIRYVVHHKKRRTTKDQLFTRILAAIEKTDGRLKIAGATIGIADTPVIDVRINDHAPSQKARNI